ASYGTTYRYPVETRSAEKIILPMASRCERGFPPNWMQARAGRLPVIFTKTCRLRLFLLRSVCLVSQNWSTTNGTNLHEGLNSVAGLLRVTSCLTSRPSWLLLFTSRATALSVFMGAGV